MLTVSIFNYYVCSIIFDLIIDEGINDSENNSSEDWTKIVDRGGLIHVSDAIYSSFVAMELELRNCISKSPLTDSVKDLAIQSIVENGDLLNSWTIVSVNWDDEESNELLKLIVEHWVKIRGFSMASSFIEKYKQARKKTLQKSKALRKNLVS